MIYLDNSATTQPYPEVLDVYQQVAETYFANPSSIHSQGGEAEKLLMRSRQQVADLLHVKAKEVIFTSGGSESNNLAIKGTALKYSGRGKHLVTTAIEHASTYEAFRQLESLGFEVTWLPVDETGHVSVSAVKEAIRPDTILVSIIHVNNEIGSVQPIEEIGALLRDYPKILFHTDHVQGIGKVPLDDTSAGVDLCSISAHKFHGPRGTGMLYVRDGVALMPLISGGAHEEGLRAGTENLPAIVAMAKALRMHLEDSQQKRSALHSLRTDCMQKLAAFSDIQVHTPHTETAPHIINFSIVGMKPEVVIHALERQGVFVSTKSACSSQSAGASRVLLAIGSTEEVASAAIRVSFSLKQTESDVDAFLQVLQRVLQQYPRMEDVH